MALSDEELLAAVSRGDKAAMEVLVYRYHTSIYKYVYRLTGNEILAQDITQETFLRMIRAIKGGSAPQRFKPWLYRIASNLCYDMWRSAVYRYEEVCDVGGRGELAEGNMIDLLERQELRARVIKAVTDLPMDIRQTVVLHYYEDMKVKDIASVMDIPEGTVKSRLHRAYRLLKEQLGRERGGAAGEM